MFKSLLFSSLLILTGYNAKAQSGRYFAILQDGMCQNGTAFTWFANPKIIVISPAGAITETPLNTATSVADVLDHVAAFNVVVSNIMDQGYTISGAAGNSTTTYFTALGLANNLGFPDGACPAGSTTNTYSQGITLIPCCAPWTNGVDIQSENVPLLISKVFPNPSNNLIHLEIEYSLGNEPKDVLIYDIMGNELLKVAFSSYPNNNVELNISKLSSGLYFVQLNGASGDSKPMPFSVY